MFNNILSIFVIILDNQDKFKSHNFSKNASILFLSIMRENKHKR